MFACGPCHAKHHCPAGRHERTYWEKCEVCGEERQCFDCMMGRKIRNHNPGMAKHWGITAYLHTGRIYYKRGEQP